MDKVREVIEKNRSRKLTKHKKLPNNTLIEIDSCSPLEILRLHAIGRNLNKYHRFLHGEIWKFEGKTKKTAPFYS